MQGKLYSFILLILKTRTLLLLARILCLLPFVVAALRLSWLSDDSLITLRHILNITHGWSFGFNATENVQGYTHPLWMLAWTGLGQITQSWTISIVVFGLTLSAISLLMILHLTNKWWLMVLAVVTALSSNAIVEYSTSGLENPLSSILAILILVLTFRNDHRPQSHFAIGMLVALLLLTRLDLLVLAIVPVLFWLNSTRPMSAMKLGCLLAGCLPPLLGWYWFSYATYGSFLPNTFLAKRNLEIEMFSLVKQGVHYVWFSVRNDPATGMLLVSASTTAILSKSSVLISWIIGIFLYTLYVIQNGGDFMVSRFLSVQSFLAIAILVKSVDLLTEEIKLRDIWMPLATGMGFLGLLLTVSVPTAFRADSSKQRWSFDSSEARGIADERPVYAGRGLALFVWLKNPDGFPGEVTIEVVERQADNWPTSKGALRRPESVKVDCGLLGSTGILRGPLHHAIDECALTDRFLANKKYNPGSGGWRIGHFVRSIPEGYEEAILNSDPSFMTDHEDEQKLRELWSVIRK